MAAKITGKMLYCNCSQKGIISHRPILQQCNISSAPYWNKSIHWQSEHFNKYTKKNKIIPYSFHDGHSYEEPTSPKTVQLLPCTVTEAWRYHASTAKK